MGKTKKKKKRTVRIIKFVAGIVFCLLLIGVFSLFVYFVFDIANDIRGKDGLPEDVITIEVVNGDSTRIVSEKLQKSGLIKYPLLFRLYAQVAEVDTKLQIGQFEFPADSSYTRICEILVTHTVRESVRMMFPEGVEVSTIISMLVNNGIGTESGYWAAIANTDFGYDFLPEIGMENRLEGYLFPDTYDFFVDESEESILKRFIDNFYNKVVKAGLQEKAADAGMTLHEAITLASIIQNEGARADFGNISSVFHNRLNAGMTLSSDATINYLLPQSERRGRTTAENLLIDSPYNTYKYGGYPPTGISNPGYYAILAAVEYPKTGYYYFCADGNGGTVFAKTFEEHEANIAKYLNGTD